MKYKILWTTKDGRTIEDAETFDSEEEAGTYIGIEMTQMETEEVATYKILPISEEECKNLEKEKITWLELKMPINTRQLKTLKDSLELHIDLIRKTDREVLNFVERDKMIKKWDDCMTLLHTIDGYTKAGFE